MDSGSENDASRGLLEFKAQQKILEIGGVSIGGQPGVQPTVLIGSMFYRGHDICVDEDKGEFHPDKAEKLIRAKEESAKKTGNPCMLDVVGATPEAICRHLEFAANTTDMPLVIDGTTADVRLAGIRYALGAGLIDRVVYNTIQPGISDEELLAISESGVQSATILAWHMSDLTAKGRVDMVRELIPKVEAAGVRKFLIDTCVLDLATLGQAYSAMFDLKDELGMPVGGGVHNAVSVWRGLKSKMGDQAYNPCIASAAAAAVAVGADFIFYGPVEDANVVFPAVAMIDTALSQLVIDRGMQPAENHPRYRIG